LFPMCVVHQPVVVRWITAARNTLTNVFKVLLEPVFTSRRPEPHVQPWSSPHLRPWPPRQLFYASVI
jgi:hypothetical protein